MSPNKRKKMSRKAEEENDAATGSPTAASVISMRRSRRLRGDEVEFTEDRLEEFERERRSRSRSATPMPDFQPNEKLENPKRMHISFVDAGEEDSFISNKSLSKKHEKIQSNEEEPEEEEDMLDRDFNGNGDFFEDDQHAEASNQKMAESDEGGESDCNYEEDIEDAQAQMLRKRRSKLPKSVVDDQFFNLAEMNAFLDEQEKQEECKSRNLGQFDNAEDMEQLIKSYEEENLKVRSWQLSGEIEADKRRKDELLEHYVDVDYRAAAPPVITAETTSQLESIIAKRIKESLFDDVIRKVRINEALVPANRNKTDALEHARKSLAEVYGDKFNAQLNNDEEENGSVGGLGQGQSSQLDPAVESIKQDLDTLFLQLDALSHFQLRPQPIRSEVKVVNNMPSLTMEEVGPNAAVEPEVSLLAPEEVVKHAKTAPKADEEATVTDRKRQRRRKKKKQRILASIGAMNCDEKVGKLEDGAEVKKVKRLKKKSKLAFADHMNNLLQQGETGNKKRKLKKETHKRKEAS